MEGLLPLHCSFVQTIGEKLPALVPILRPVPDLVICKKDPPDLLLFPTELQFKFKSQNYNCEQTKLRKAIKTLIDGWPKFPASNASKLIKEFNCIFPSRLSLAVCPCLSRWVNVAVLKIVQMGKTWEESAATLGRDSHPDQVLAELGPIKNLIRIIICPKFGQTRLLPSMPSAWIFEILGNEMSQSGKLVKLVSLRWN